MPARLHRKARSNRPRKNPGKMVSPRNQMRSTPQEVLVTLNLGLQILIPLSTPSSVSSSTLNDPLGVVLDWASRSADFLTYRVVAIDVWAAPVSTGATTPTVTQTKQWVSALTDLVDAVTTPATANFMLELPQSQIRPMDTANPQYRRHIRWRCSDLNSLLYGSTINPPPGRKAVFSCSTTAAVTGWAIQVHGRMTVEFKGLASV